MDGYSRALVVSRVALLGHRDELQSIAGTKPSPLLEVDPLSSNGRTVVFGAIYRGSNPCDGTR
jgi:hypothetical protein